MKIEQIGIFINNKHVEYLVGICIKNNLSTGEEKLINLAQDKDKIFVQPLKNIKSNMIKKFDISEFKNQFKEELNFVNNFNKEKNLSLSHLQILQITYILNSFGDNSEKSILETINNLDKFYKENLK